MIIMRLFILQGAVREKGARDWQLPHKDTMRLLTHNMVQCLKCAHFPLRIHAASTSEISCPVKPAFLSRMMERVDWPALRQAAEDLGITDLPEQAPTDLGSEEHAEVMNSLHHLLQEVVVVEGSLRCPSCSMEYSISDSIPNMILPETEVAHNVKTKGATGAAGETAKHDEDMEEG